MSKKSKVATPEKVVVKQSLWKRTLDKSLKTIMGLWKWLWRGVKGIWGYFREFWYIRVDNGKTQYIPSSKKFWAQISQIILVVMVYYRILGSEEISARITDVLLGIAFTHCATAMSWYSYTKHKDINKIEEALHNHIPVSDPAEENEPPKL